MPALLRWPLLWVLLLGLGLLPELARASHIRAGDIQARIDTTGVNPRRVFFKMVLYTDNVSPVLENNVVIFFGDGTTTGRPGIARSTATPLPIPGSPDTSLNIYLFEHTFPSSGRFVVSYIGENRNSGVRNMDNSDQQTFYISTTIQIDPLLGRNRSPVLNAPAVDKGAVSQVFLHNPAASDADGDSLAFKLRNCMQVPGGVDAVLSASGNNRPVPVTCAGYRLPNDQRVTPSITPVQVPYNGVPSSTGGGPAIFDMNINTGQITWNAPVLAGFYNVAFVVEEWRRTPLGARLIGEVVRDMQIIVRATNNLRPSITVPADICVVAGTPVSGTVTATDGAGPGQAPSPITLFAYGGMLPPATFTQTLAGPPLASGTFRWTPDCSNIAQLPHQVVFKAQDTPQSPNDPPLIDQRIWRITVVGPPPQNLQAARRISPVGLSTLLTWNRYQCQNASNIYIYRKENTSRFTPGPCETGIPASAGYTRIATVTAATQSFIDENVVNGMARGLDRGKTYCYRIYAEFPLPAGGSSIASQEACVTFPGRSAQLTHVDVDRTDVSNGQITVRWTQPRTASDDLSFDGPAGYRISRAQSTNPMAFTLVRTITDLNNTTLVDTGLNTRDLQYTYRLEFFYSSASGPGAQEVVEIAPTASSVYTSTVPDGLTNRITVSWRYQVPWDNTQRPATIYRRSPGGSFTMLGTAPTGATGGSYIDQDPSLRKFETYCYYVQTEGRYEATGPLSSLLNKSQERCAELTNQPCTPVLTLLPTNCDSLAALPEFPTSSQRYANRLRWVFGTTPAGCNASASYYRIFYRPGNSGPFALIDSTRQTTYTHRDLAASGGCYQVQAVDVSGVRSERSNIACQDNCVFFVLPNIFTPNGDGRNDVFRPKTASPLRRVTFRAYNRWGVKVFENTTTSETFINWDGGGPVGESSTSGSPKVVDGVYFYQAEVEFADSNNTKRIYKGWVEVAR
ncbi:hypothetical protein GCM10023185_22820 [Hymenobacter saemangeumensis]|uniref:Gliding motility-associated C-terminal domain-containing protein n=1 Tax=Hymenobacter saemangeumensis TaxID=1084522 RepID=A0ABP8IFH2_9BACT